MRYYTGMREGKRLFLTRVKVYLIEGKITLEAGDTKTGEGRIIYVTGELYEAISSLVMDTEARYPGCPLVFHMQGKPIRDFRFAWDKAFETARLERRIFHDLRRTAIKNMVRAGVSERVAMRVSGHKTQSVFDRYNVTSEADLKAASERITAYHRGC